MLVGKSSPGYGHWTASLDCVSRRLNCLRWTVSEILEILYSECSVTFWLHVSGTAPCWPFITHSCLSFSNCASLVKLCFSFLTWIDEWINKLNRLTVSVQLRLLRSGLDGRVACPPEEWLVDCLDSGVTTPKTINKSNKYTKCITIYRYLWLGQYTASN